MKSRLICFILLLSSMLAYGQKTLPITGTWINLAYQDERNLYMNPHGIDSTNPELWETKVRELNEMGVEYLVFMAVANDEKAYYPSKMMPHHFPEGRKSPVDAIMDEAAKLGMKVFLSTGWAKDQNDKLRDPAVKQGHINIMVELAGIYKDHKAFYGWYLPVEDCLGPVLTDYAVEAVNQLTEKAKSLTPNKKVLTSPYGIFLANFDNPKFAEQIGRLKVDIIAYQDEVGCVREEYPMVRLRDNWKKLREIHDKIDIEMWANCETFTWTKNTNSRRSALIPCSYTRLLEQQVIASEGGAEKIISFSICGILDKPASVWSLGQPHWSNVVYQDYMDWKTGKNRYWIALEKSFYENKPWIAMWEGDHEFKIDNTNRERIKEVFVSFQNHQRNRWVVPSQVSLAISDDGVNYKTVSVQSNKGFANTLHDAFSDGFLFTPNTKAPYLKVFFNSPDKCKMRIDTLK